MYCRFCDQLRGFYYENGKICMCKDQDVKETVSKMKDKIKSLDFEKLASEFLQKFPSGRGGNCETKEGYILAIKEFSIWLHETINEKL